MTAPDGREVLIPVVVAAGVGLSMRKRAGQPVSMELYNARNDTRCVMTWDQWAALSVTLGEMLGDAIIEGFEAEGVDLVRRDESSRAEPSHDG